MKAVPASRIAVFCAIVLAGVAADLGAKDWIFARLGMPGVNRPWWIINNVVGFQTSLNEGALFGLGTGKTALFSLLSVMAALGILWWLFWKGAAQQWFLTIALAGVMAGILGNLYDRMGMHGLHWHYTNDLHNLGDPVYAVRDWILVMIGTWAWPNFNIADSLLVGGAGMLLAQAFLQTDVQTAPSKEKETDRDPKVAARLREAP